MVNHGGFHATAPFGQPRDDGFHEIVVARQVGLRPQPRGVSEAVRAQQRDPVTGALVIIRFVRDEINILKCCAHTSALCSETMSLVCTSSRTVACLKPYSIRVRYEEECLRLFGGLFALKFRGLNK